MLPSTATAATPLTRWAARAPAPLWWAAAACGVPGLLLALTATSAGFARGEGDRILFVHVPAAGLALSLYVAMAAAGALTFFTAGAGSALLARAIAPTGALMTFLALWTGSLWGKPAWGSWWVWDARLTSALLLLFLYAGFIALQAVIDDPRRGDRAGALLAMAGALNLPLIHGSVGWWNAQHPLAAGGPAHPPAGPASVSAALALTAAALALWCAAAVLHRLRTLALERESRER